MAEIEIQRKKPPIWPWILGALVIVGLLWFLVARTNRDGAEPTAATIPATTELAMADSPGAILSEVEAFVTFVEENRATAEMGLDHNYTSTGIRNLAEAIQAIAQRTDNNNQQIEQQYQELLRMANQIQKDPMSTQHADVIREAFITSANLMEQVQSSLFPQLQNEVSQVRQAAQSVQPEELTLDQKQEIQSFFDRASDVLQAMEEAAGRNANVAG